MDKTANGYDISEVKSCLQKTIRRGLEREAMFWALEMAESEYWEPLWNRLEIIVNEDIGLANPQLIVLIHTLRKQADMLRELENNNWYLMLANAIMSMCRTPKSREADHFQCVVRYARKLENFRLEVPDYAYDKHTRKGRELGRHLDHFRKEGAKLCPEHHDPYEEEAYRLWKKVAECEENT